MTTPSTEPWTVLRLLQWTSDFFKSRGSESPRLDAEILLAHARDCERIELYTAFAEVPSDEQRIAFRELVRRRGEGAPVAQLVGFREFYSIPIRVDENVLVPRPETEHLVVEAIDQAKRIAATVADRPLRILDIGTGSGAIAIAIAKNLKDAEVVAVDVSLAALDIARWNVEKQKLSDRITLMQSDLFEALQADAKFDVICSNPPYISQSEYDSLPDTVRNHEPRGALLAGQDGTEIISRILADAPAHLFPGGRLVLEYSPMIADSCKAMAEGSGKWNDIKRIRDLAGHQRILSLGQTA
ncbi:peptide chain release factor N(5)-glutamine methyltransferase [Allorhodopirellula heiligendammensis]|uniref:Release factor glutamine methyltransferase n=1 Tax=Allorhodopirellula heiligendammensis TaxID=2714739 RepID=A0A5C6BWD5_9BACT|nr:peptide chain release factor N(5)-glutamine methyltransferase [Allorhodopirellula heiligendammensis]TWU16318.1 Release factor glutamine methyltransferase [Allorhodopirellula heiligendammensis]